VTVDNRGADVLFGGWDQDALQADVSKPNPNDVDKLIDTAGAYNGFFVCENAYGGNSILRLISPSMQIALQLMATGDGAVAAGAPNTSGARELSMIFSADVKNNTNPGLRGNADDRGVRVLGRERPTTGPPPPAGDGGPVVGSGRGPPARARRARSGQRARASPSSGRPRGRTAARGTSTSSWRSTRSPHWQPLWPRSVTSPCRR
jgi:hypothetical protein